MLIEYCYSNRNMVRRVMIMQGGKARAKASRRAGKYPVIILRMKYTSQCTTEQLPQAPFDTAVQSSSKVEYQGANQAIQKENRDSQAENLAGKFVCRKVQDTIDPGCLRNELFREERNHTIHPTNSF